MRIAASLTLALGLVLLASSAATAQPQLTNARLEQQSASAGLERTIQAIVNRHTSPAWIGYSVPVIPGERFMCCGWSGDSTGWNAACGCRLEGGQAGATTTREPIKLEGPTHMLVLLRAESRQIGKVRSYSVDCPLDAGGLPFYWLTDVRPNDSVAFLGLRARQADANTGRADSTGRGALVALALHRDDSADTMLTELVGTSQPMWLRRDAAFWLGSARGRKGFEVLSRVVPNDPSVEFRKQAVFAFSTNDTPEAIEVILGMARSDASADVRGQALFWLAQKAGKKAVGTITDAIENDPETQVKERAVFALSQLPKDEGVPKLIEVARTNRNPKVRQRAIFWLGQSKDPRALKFFEEILGR